MLNVLSHFTFDEVHIAVCISFVIVALYEWKFGKPKLFEEALKNI